VRYVVLIYSNPRTWETLPQAERERVERERLAREQAEHQRIQRERLAREQAERERVERERLDQEHAERVRLAREDAERERVARERAERELAARDKAARELAERERLAREQAERERAERERIARELADRERAARQQAEREHVERERLAREQAAREAAERDKLVRELAAQAQALTAAVKAAQQMPQVSGAIPAPVRRTSSRVLRRPKPQRKPQKKGGQLQDEWGLYDPGAAGFEALYARLEQEEAGRIVEPEPATAAELLMEAPATAGRPAKTKKRKRRNPAPLAMWVQCRVETAPAADAARADFALDTLMDELNLPGGVASAASLDFSAFADAEFVSAEQLLISDRHSSDATGHELEVFIFL